MHLVVNITLSNKSYVLQSLNHFLIVEHFTLSTKVKHQLKHHSPSSWKFSPLFNSPMCILLFTKNARYQKHKLVDAPWTKVRISHINFWKDRGTFLAFILTLHLKWGSMHYLLQLVWTKKSMAIGHFLTHVSCIMFNNTNGGKEEMFTM
jgi:hypothetical protein